MRIAVNTRFLLDGKMEGIGVYTEELCKRWVKWHPESEFHFLFDRPYSSRFIYGENVVPHVLYPPARHPILWWWWYEMAVTRVLKKIAADVFFSPDMFLSLRSKCPTILASHDLSYVHFPEHLRWSHRIYFDRYFPKYHQKADRIACVSECTRKDVISQYDIAEEKVSTVYNAAGKNFKRLEIGDIEKVRHKHFNGKPYLLYLGSVHPRKNLDRLLDAYDLFRSSCECSYPLVLAGRWAWKTSSTRQKLKKMKYRHDVILLAEYEEWLYELVGSAHALIYISLYEGFGLPMIEAMQSNVPVIASDIPVHREVAGSAALFVDPFDVVDIASGLEQISAPTGLRKTLAQNGLEQAALYDWNTSAEVLFKLLLQVSSSSGTNT